MATSVQVKVFASVNGYTAVQTPPGPSVPLLPLVIPSAAIGGLLSLAGPWVSQTDLKSQSDYESFVQGIVQSRLGPSFSVQSLESGSRPHVVPPPYWIYDSSAYVVQLQKDGKAYTEPAPGASATATIGWVISIHAP